MTQPALAESTQQYGRMYRRSLAEQPTVPSITTVISRQPHGLDGWFGHMAATALAGDPRLAAAVGNAGEMRALLRDACNAAELYRDAAAARGDRVHRYCEQVALRALGQGHAVAESRTALEEHGEEKFAARFDEWWQQYRVEPIATEITVWNRTVGYAGTLDLVARIGGRVCLIDYKTKGTDRDRQVKPLDEKVVMQLVAGMKAEESLVDAARGEWEPWQHGADPLLLGVAIGETEVRPMRANPEVLKYHWHKFCALRRVWETSVNSAEAGRPLLPVGPPPVLSDGPGGGAATKPVAASQDIVATTLAAAPASTNNDAELTVPVSTTAQLPRG